MSLWLLTCGVEMPFPASRVPPFPIHLSPLTRGGWQGPSESSGCTDAEPELGEEDLMELGVQVGEERSVSRELWAVPKPHVAACFLSDKQVIPSDSVELEVKPRLLVFREDTGPRHPYTVPFAPPGKPALHFAGGRSPTRDHAF